jgi:transposase
MTILSSTRPVTGGVDTHLDQHVVAVVDGVGGVLGVARFPVTPAGYRRLLAWMRGYGRVERVGVEGTGSYGAGLSRHLLEAGLVVLEVTRPTVKSVTATAKTTTSTRSRLRVLRSLVGRWRPPRTASAMPRRCGCWSVRNAQPSKRGSRRWSNSGI